MSDLEKKLAAKKDLLEAKLAEEVSRVKRSLATRMGRGIAWCCLGLVVLVLVLFLGFAWYTTTPDFERRVNKKVVKVLEDATGGRVELGRVSFNFWHLGIEAHGLVIHGLEGPGEAPYLSADTIQVRMKIAELCFSCGRERDRVACESGLSAGRPSAGAFDDRQGWEDEPAGAEASQHQQYVQCRIRCWI